MAGIGTSGNRDIGSSLNRLIFPTVVLGVVGGLLAGYLIGISAPGFGFAEAAAILIGLVVLTVGVRSLLQLRRRVRLLVDHLGNIEQATIRLADEDLPQLVKALGRPEPSLEIIPPLGLAHDGPSEVKDLTNALEELRLSLEEVAWKQMVALKGGVSSMIVTLAKRSASLVDRQLALLDQLESREEDPQALHAFYQIDHFASRMRRNAESLVVLAGEQSPRVWAKSMDLSEVIRAAIGEVEDYERIEIMGVESAQLAGGAVTDIAHLLAELLENATQFSPPNEPVKISALFDLDMCRINITDRGVGMTNEKIAELNEILANPPALGLNLKPTMGVYVVSKLAARHGVNVELAAGIPGLTARVNLPQNLLERGIKMRPSMWATSRFTRDPEPREPAELVTHSDRDTSGVLASATHPPGRSGSHVVDLTNPAMVSEDAVDIDESELPVRSPGRAFTAHADRVVAEVGVEGAAQIQSALADFDRGRQAAQDREDATDPIESKDPEVQP